MSNYRRMFLSPVVSLLLVIFFSILLLTSLVAAQNGASSTAVQHVVFTKWLNPPKGWTKYDVDNSTVSNLRWLRLPKGIPRAFNFMLVSFDLTYIHSAPAPGDYVIRIGLIERPSCSSRRLMQYVVNGAESVPVNIGKECGCGIPYFVDIPFSVDDDKLFTLSMKKFKGFWAPVISNFELFPADDAPTPFVCPSSTAMSSPTPTGTPVSAGTLAPSVAASPAPSSAVTETPSPLPSSDASSTPLLPSSDASSTPSATPTPSDKISFEDVNIDIDIGPSYSILGTTGVTFSGNLDTSSSGGLPAASFTTAREGSDFAVTFDLPAGTYNVLLGFIEGDDDNCAMSARVFNVLINGNMRLEAYDIYTAAGGCRKAVVERFLMQTVDALEPKPFVVSFQGIAGLAIISHLRIIPSNQQCEPVTTDADVTADHLAHSVPGEYPPNGDPSYVDSDGDGFVSVSIDGSGSHTHFSYNGRNGLITSYTWIIPETGKVVSTTQKFTRNFPLGTTRLRLAVVDDVCSRDEAETSVTVTGRMQAGQYCYYYQGLTELPIGGSLTEPPLPTFVSVSSSLNLGFPAFSFRDSNFVARCVFFVEFSALSASTDISIATGGSGDARVYKGVDLILDTQTSPSATTGTTIGLQEFEVVYRRTDLSKTPALTFRVNNTVPSATYDQSTVLPIITGIDPNSGSASGGDRVKVSGYGLYQPLTVSFGNVNVSALQNGANAGEFFVITPSGLSGTVAVRVTTNAGRQSNAVEFSYGSTCDSVAFNGVDLTTPSGAAVDLGLPTAVTTWQDGSLFIGSRLGVVRQVKYDYKTLTTTSICYSAPLRDSRYVDTSGNPSTRSILGITFDPRDKTPRPYLSVSTLFWQRQGGIALDDPRAWSNGAIERMRPASSATLAADPDQCLEYDQNIVRYLPVADGDHSVNELVFLQNGDLAIAVGGNTNAGLPYVNLGGNWETYLSGAVVVAKLSRSTFNGEIDYTTPENLRTAVPKSDDVDLYATGVRNMFSMTMARSGLIYGADMGPNCRFGNASSSCSEYNETEAAQRSDRFAVPFPGSAIVGPEGECKYGDTRKDKLLQIKEGRFYGHSNIQRALATNKLGECGWIDPLTGTTGAPARSPAPSNYDPLMSFVQSPTTGVQEYGSALFCSRLRGDLILSRYKARGVFRVKLNSDGTEVVGNPDRFDDLGGLRVDENVHGDLLFPKLYPDGKGIYVLRPKVSSRTGVMVVNALPFRHGKAGGTRILIGGWGFAEGAAAFIGGKACATVERTETQISCVVPSHGGGSLSVDVKVTVGASESVLTDAVLYMSV